MTSDYLRRLGRFNARRVARSILAVQPIDPDIMTPLFDLFNDVNQNYPDLAAEGYEPVSDHKLLWIKKDQE